MDEEKTIRSRMSPWQTAAALVWIPIHILGLPLLLIRLRQGMDGAELNFAIYAIGAAVLGLVCVPFLRRDFRPFREDFRRILLLALLFYGYTILANMLVNRILSLVSPGENPNNQAVMALAAVDRVKILAVTLVLAPFLEELMFRAGLFGLLRRRSRVLAYAVCALAFAAYHVWEYALAEPLYWVLMLQYVPVTLLLCRLYEKTESIWSSILLHALSNGVSMLALYGMERMGL